MTERDDTNYDEPCVIELDIYALLNAADNLKRHNDSEVIDAMASWIRENDKLESELLELVATIKTALQVSGE